MAINALRLLIVRFVALVALIACLAITIERAANAEVVPSSWDHTREYLTRHCVECHGPKKQESDLRLDTLSIDVRDPAAGPLWLKVVERVEAGEMPPEDQPRPDAKQTARVLGNLRQQLAAAARRSAISRPGRGPRRLNRIEYQNSVNELLGIDLDLANYLPEDGSIDGFDKVGRALNISAVQVERYLEAADVAILEALVEKPAIPSTKQRYTFWNDCRRARSTFTRNGVWAENEDAVFSWYTNDKFFYIESFEAPARGKYRIQISAYGTLLGDTAQRTDDPVVLALHGGEFRSSNRVSHRVGFFSTDWEHAQVFEAVDLLEKGHSFKLTIAGQPAKTFKVVEFTGPALAVQWVDIEGPLDDGAVERRRQMLLGSVDPQRGTPADADRLLQQFAERAFRRPTTDVEVAPYRALMQAQFARGANFLEALSVGMKTVLCAPQFLFVDQNVATLDDYAIASRLSYFLWSAPPDPTLLAAAASGQLRDPHVRQQQVERLLGDPRSATFTRHFLDSWLELKKIDFTTPDRDLYPEFDEPLRDSIVRETHAFFDELLAHDLSVLNFIDSGFAMLNERLARHYNVPNVRGDEIRKVTLPADRVRGGILTQASVLKVTADGTVTSPVLRGVWLLDRIMGRPVPPPPPGVPGVEPDIRGATTIRQQLAKHRQLASCGACHKKIDPPGFALENFDPIGGWRDRYRILDPKQPGLLIDGERVKYVFGPVVDAGDRMPDGRQFADIRRFKELLLSDPLPIADNVARKLLTYALGRELDAADHEQLRTLLARLESNGYGLRSLVKEIAASDAFVNP